MICLVLKSQLQRFGTSLQIAVRTEVQQYSGGKLRSIFSRFTALYSYIR